MTALDAAENHLTDLFAWQSDEKGNRLLIYAPQASWVAAEDGSGHGSLRLRPRKTRQMRIDRKDTGPDRLTTMSFPRLVIDLPRPKRAVLAEGRGEGNDRLDGRHPTPRRFARPYPSSAGSGRLSPCLTRDCPVSARRHPHPGLGSPARTRGRNEKTHSTGT